MATKINVNNQFQGTSKEIIGIVEMREETREEMEEKEMTSAGFLMIG